MGVMQYITHNIKIATILPLITIGQFRSCLILAKCLKAILISIRRLFIQNKSFINLLFYIKPTVGFWTGNSTGGAIVEFIDLQCWRTKGFNSVIQILFHKLKHFAIQVVKKRLKNLGRFSF